MKSTWAFKARAESNDQLCLDIYDTIGADPLFGGGLSAKSVLGFLAEYPKAKSLMVRINSAGGIVTEGLAIYNLLKQSSAKVTCRVDALAGSIASIIALGGGTLEMAEHSYLMIHNPYGWIQGGSSELRHQADVLDSMRDEMLSIYCAKSGKSREFIGALMDEETWLTGTQALAYGLCDRLIPDSSVKLVAHFDLSQFRNTPRSLDPERQAVAQITTDNLKDAVRDALAAVAEESALSTESPGAPAADATTEEVTVTDSPAAKPAASGAPTMDEQVYKDQIAALEAKVAELTAALEGEKSARAKAEAEVAEAKAKFPKRDEDEEEDDDDEGEMAKAAVVAACVALTGEKDLVRLEGAVMALGPKLNSSANAKAAREVQVSGLIAKGKLLPAQKGWAMSCKPEALSAYLESIGDAQVCPGTTTEHTPGDNHENVVAARATAAATATSKTFDPESVQLTAEEIKYCEVRDGKGATSAPFKAQFLAQKRELAKAEFEKKRNAAA
jgi:ATP-dependent Clp endopeptidase proteolytic subunit ClpP